LTAAEAIASCRRHNMAPGCPSSIAQAGQ
jgi:hypothetical protein